MDRRDLLKVAGGAVLAGASSAYAFRFLSAPSASWTNPDIPTTGRKWGMVIDLNRCRQCPPECNACVEACRNENNVAFHGDPKYPEWDVHWIRKVVVEKKAGAEAGEAAEQGGAEAAGVKSVILLCNHCDRPPCAQVCPVQATYKRRDGIVIVDHHRCIGCRYCMIACPYNARYFNFKDTDENWRPNPDFPKRSHGVAEACTLCAHLLDVGRKPACVEACEKACGKEGGGALFVGDLNDPDSEVSRLIAGGAVQRLRADLGTEPKVYYIGL
jgi:molybdopterin-containing oxidoreductase family iron-sulfur binding subunit